MGMGKKLSAKKVLRKKVVQIYYYTITIYLYIPKTDIYHLLIKNCKLS